MECLEGIRNGTWVLYRIKLGRECNQTRKLLAQVNTNSFLARCEPFLQKNYNITHFILLISLLRDTMKKFNKQ